MPKGIYPRKPRTKLKDMEQLDGKLYTDEATDPVEEPAQAIAAHKPRTLDEIMGIEPTSKYKITNTEEYEAFLRDLNGTDLAREAEKVGVVHHHDLVRTRKILVAEHARYFNTRVGGQSRTTNDLNSVSPEVRKILAEGR